MAHVATVTIDNTKVPSDQTDFVVYVDLSDLPTTEFWGTVANGGGDIRCYKSDGTTELAREVVSCDTATDTGELHVRFTGTLSSSVDTEIQIWTDEGTEPAATATYGRNAVWADYELASHDLVTDSSGNHTLSLVGTVTVNDWKGDPRGKGFGSTDGVGSSDSVGTWITATSTQRTYQTWAYSYGTTNARFFDKFNESLWFVGGLGESLQQYFSGSNLNEYHAETNNVWAMRHVAYDYSSTSNKPSMYVNGSAQSTTSFSSPTGIATTNSSQIVIGNRPAGDRVFDGSMAGFRIRNTLLSDDWVSTEYTNQSAPSTFYTATAVGGGADVSPYGLQALHRSYQPVAASRLNGVMQ